MRQGVFIAIEGSDGSGKGTQFKLLVERLKAEGYDVATYDFPQYDNESSYYVRQYLNGSYGNAETLGPYTPSLFYALDRFSAAENIAEDLAAGKVVISNRFSGSNMAHQGTKFATKEERRAFFEWLDQLEFGMLQIPKPDQNIVLLVPAETAQQLVDQKAQRSYTTKKRDIHEADLSHLQRAVEVYQQLCEVFPENFSAIDCTKNNELMSIPTINNLIWERIEPMLGRLHKRKGDSSQNSDELTENNKKDDLPKTAAANEDGGTQSANNIRLIVETSSFLSQKLQQIGSDIQLAQPASQILLEKKGVSKKLEYHTPTTLAQDLMEYYTKHMDTLLEKHSELSQKLAEYTRSSSNTPKRKRDAAWERAVQAQVHHEAQSVLPVATKSTVDLTANSEALKNLILHLQTDQLTEARQISGALLKEVRDFIPTSLDQIDAKTAYQPPTELTELVKKKSLQPLRGVADEAVQLVSFWPRNELDSLPQMLYAHSTLGLDELSKEINKWSYQEKEAAFTAHLTQSINVSHQPNRALEVVQYTFDIVSSYAALSDFQQYYQAIDSEQQALTPHYGFETPELISESGLDALYEECFEISMKLYHYLIENGYTEEAQYATLLGHKLRWSLTLNAQQAKRLIGQNKLIHTVHEKIAEVHPLTASAMKRVN